MSAFRALLVALIVVLGSSWVTAGVLVARPSAPDQAAVAWLVSAFVLAIGIPACTALYRLSAVRGW